MGKKILKSKNRDPGNYRHWMPPPFALHLLNWEHREEYPSLRIIMPPFMVFIFVIYQLDEVWQMLAAGALMMGAVIGLNFIWARRKARECRRSRREASVNVEE